MVTESIDEHKENKDEPSDPPPVSPVSPAIKIEGTTDLLGEIVGDDSFDMSWDISPTKRISMMLSEGEDDDEEFSLVITLFFRGFSSCLPSFDIYNSKKNSWIRIRYVAV